MGTLGHIYEMQDLKFTSANASSANTPVSEISSEKEIHNSGFNREGLVTAIGSNRLTVIVAQDNTKKIRSAAVDWRFPSPVAAQLC